MVADSGKEIQTAGDCLIEKKFNSLEENSCREPLSRLEAAFSICHEASSTRHQFNELFSKCVVHNTELSALSTCLLVLRLSSNVARYKVACNQYETFKYTPR